MNSLNLVGRVAKDIKLKEVGQKNIKMIRNVLAVTDSYDREKTNFIQFVIFGKSAENFEQVVNKGDLVGILNSELKVDNYESKEGEKKRDIYALASRWQLYKKKQENNSNEELENFNEEKQFNDSDSWLFDDDLPF